jgi:hypothetical protein
MGLCGRLIAASDFTSPAPTTFKFVLLSPLLCSRASKKQVFDLKTVSTGSKTMPMMSTVKIQALHSTGIHDRLFILGTLNGMQVVAVTWSRPLSVSLSGSYEPSPGCPMRL